MWKSAGRAPPKNASFYPGICLTTEEEARKNLSQGMKNLSQVKKTSVITKSTHTHFTKQYKTTTVH
jgi:hypothetical protein